MCPVMVTLECLAHSAQALRYTLAFMSTGRGDDRMYRGAPIDVLKQVGWVGAVTTALPLLIA
jgi:hypothetical protein